MTSCWLCPLILYNLWYSYGNVITSKSELRLAQDNSDTWKGKAGDRTTNQEIGGRPDMSLRMPQPNPPALTLTLHLVTVLRDRATGLIRGQKLCKGQFRIWVNKVMFTLKYTN